MKCRLWFLFDTIKQERSSLKNKKGKGIKMAKYEIKQEFRIIINDVVFDDRYIYYATGYILDLIEARLGEV